MKTLFLKRIVPVLWLFSLVYTLPVYDKYWAPFDEGIITVAAQRLLAGEMPYKDFFIVMYPPGQIYILAVLFYLFGPALIAARIYTALVSVATSMLVFFMTRILTKNSAISIFSWLIVLTSLAPRLGAIPSPIWPGVLFGILSIYIFMVYLGNGELSFIIISGLIAGLAIAFRHDIGIFASISILLSLFLHKGTAPIFVSASRRKIGAVPILLFICAILFITLPWVMYFIVKSASNDIFNSFIAFTFVHEKTAGLPFPKPCLDLNMIFHGSLHFINVNQYYIPILAYSSIFIFLLVKVLKRSWRTEECFSLLAILLFGVLTFNQVRIRTDPAHLLSVMQPAIILSAFIFHKGTATIFSSPSRKKMVAVPILAMALALFLLLALLLIKNVDKYMKNTYIKVLRKDVIKTKFDRGTIYLPKEEREEVLNTIRFIKKNTHDKERIYIGNMAHWKDDFGGSTILYFLADRLPSTKFYELLPGLITDKRVQLEIRDSLKAKDVKLIILQDVEIDTLGRSGLTEGRFILDDFIQRNYKPITKFGKYNIYQKTFR